MFPYPDCWLMNWVKLQLCVCSFKKKHYKYFINSQWFFHFFFLGFSFTNEISVTSTNFTLSAEPLSTQLPLPYYSRFHSINFQNPEWQHIKPFLQLHVMYSLRNMAIILPFWNTEMPGKGNDLNLSLNDIIMVKLAMRQDADKKESVLSC